MNETPAESPEETKPEPRWVPLSARARRIVGVLVEKAKTTPAAYPLTLNALVTGSNQKSNRAPQMNLDEEEIEDELEKLRHVGAVAEVQGSGRTSRYRHYMYEWLDVDQYELAVMTELLLRGEQTLGELRTRAARMDKIPGMSELKPIVASLKEKKLLIELTPPGRGQIVTHNLYLEREKENLKRRFPQMCDSATSEADSSANRECEPENTATAISATAGTANAGSVSESMPEAISATVTKQAVEVSREEFEKLQQEVAELRAIVAETRALLE